MCVCVAAEKEQHSEGEEQRSSKSNENAGLAGKYNNVPRIEQMSLLLTMNATRAGLHDAPSHHQLKQCTVDNESNEEVELQEITDSDEEPDHKMTFIWRNGGQENCAVKTSLQGSLCIQTGF